MIKKLSIKNYAIIEDLEVLFDAHLNILTGETGAGKSIIMGAIGLIVGERADTSVIPPGENKCIVEGVFRYEREFGIKRFLSENGLDEYDEMIIRREVTSNGKSRAFVNDTPVNLDQLRSLSNLLIDLHQQFDALQLGENDFQLQVIDAMANHRELLKEYRDYYRQWISLNSEISRLKEQKEQFDKEADYNRFQFDELEEAAFSVNELEEADAELKMLSHAEDIKSKLSKVCYELTESENPVVQQLKQLAAELDQYASYHPDLENLLKRIQETRLELKDISDDLDSISSKVNYDPDKIEKFNDRLSLGYKLLKKHSVKTTEELLKIKDELEIKIQDIQNIDGTIQQKETEAKKIFELAIKKANQISAGRKKQAKPFEEKVNELLKQVGMPNALLMIRITGQETLNDSGIDRIDFLFDANKSGQFLQVKKVASGGELSRLMLCIKSLVAKKLDLPSLVFDEIDSGISGEAARQVGIIMKDLAASRQVICITHQPQIAGKADTHFMVYKEIVKDKVIAAIRKLNHDERITAIARMLSGEKPTAAALENAREMVMN